jgi:hypothetical protein
MQKATIKFDEDSEFAMNQIIRQVIYESVENERYQFNIRCAEALNEGGFRTKLGHKFTNLSIAVYKAKAAFGPRSKTWGQT